MRWVLPLAALFQIAMIVGFAAAFWPEHLSFFVGLGVGIGVTTAAISADARPSHIERWRQGAEGEQATARALRNSRSAAGPGPRRRRRHIVVGPPGIFLINSKDLRGAAPVERGTLSVRWREDPDDGYESRSVAPRIAWQPSNWSARSAGTASAHHASSRSWSSGPCSSSGRS